jgi:hypothetical protein
MKIYKQEFLSGVQEMMDLYKQGSNIFDMKGGELFPHNTQQKTWEISQGNGAIHLRDGDHQYSFKGDLSDFDSELERMPDTPLPATFENASFKKHKVQVHRSDPGSIYFTVQEGRNNPTYTVKHMGDNKWKAIPKPKKVKQMLAEPVIPNNVNLEAVKEGMAVEFENFTKEGEGVLHSLDMGLGKGMQSLANFPASLAMFPGRLNGAVNPDQGAGEILGNALVSDGVGAGAGGLYHLAKRNLLNTQEENNQEDAEGGHALKRMLIPAGAMAGANVIDRTAFTEAMNHPEYSMFPKN